jgi:hypothetical protein
MASSCSSHQEYTDTCNECEILRAFDYNYEQGRAAERQRGDRLQAALEALYAEAPKDPRALGSAVDPVTYAAALALARRALRPEPGEAPDA